MTVIRKSSIELTSALVVEAKDVFPGCPEIYQAIHDDNGIKVLDLLSTKIGAGYTPDPNSIIRLLDAGRTDIIRKQAQSAIKQQAFYSKCAKAFHLS